jgi:hypothetical protein
VLFNVFSGSGFEDQAETAQLRSENGVLPQQGEHWQAGCAAIKPACQFQIFH